MPDETVKRAFSFSPVGVWRKCERGGFAGHTHLHPLMTDDVKGANHAEHELDDFAETLVSDTPRAVNEEDQVSFGTFADCKGREAHVCLTAGAAPMLQMHELFKQTTL